MTKAVQDILKWFMLACLFLLTIVGIRFGLFLIAGSSLPPGVTAINPEKNTYQNLGNSYWFQTPFGTIIVRRRSDVYEAYEGMKLASLRTTSIFGQTLQNGLVIDSSLVMVDERALPDDISWRIYWTFEPDRRKQLRALGQPWDKVNRSLSHEIGHAFFEAEIWKGQGLTSAPRDQITFGTSFRITDADSFRYGTSAPDWLDEFVAILMESEDITAKRRSAFHCHVLGPVDKLDSQRR